MAAWGMDTLRVTGQVGLRRVVRIGTLGKRISESTITESKAAAMAARHKQLGNHAVARGKAAWEATKAFSARTANIAKAFTALLNNFETLPVALATIVAALVASGGPDGDGGIPDLDLQLAGIDAHRSLFTHSIIAGTVVEGSLYGIATLVGHIHVRLPTIHDQWWDVIERNRVHYLNAATQGASAGIAYHLLVDGIVQPGSYHGLGVELPQSVHNTIADLNSIAEGMDVSQKRRTFTGPK